MYLGICVNNNDPEKRGRVQIFVPHVMPALYDGWNKDGNDINISCVGDNVINGLTSDKIELLRRILPWAEAASPICGTSSPGNLLNQFATAAGNAVKSVGNAISHVFNQSPVSQPTSFNAQNNADLFAAASQYGGISASEYAANSSSTGQCGVGARGILGALTNNSYFSQGIGAGGSSDAGSLAIGGGNNYLTNSGQFNAPQPMDPNALSDPSSIPVGTTVVSQGGHTGAGHIQVWSGSGWVSNFSQSPDGASAVPGTNGILGSSGGVPYNNFTVYYPNSSGSAAMGNTSTATSSTPAVPDRTSTSGEQSAAAPQSAPTGTLDTDSTSPTYGNIANPDVKNNVASSPAPAAGPQSQLATDRQSRFASELNNPELVNRLYSTAKHEVGDSPQAQQAMLETIFNRAQFGNTSITSVLNANYGPGWGGYSNYSPATNSGVTAINNVMNGSNLTGMATDNSSDTLAAHTTQRSTIGGVWLNNTTGEVVTDPNQISQLNSAGGGGSYELLYRASAGTDATSQGIAATNYASQYGLDTPANVSGGNFALSQTTVDGAKHTAMVNNTNPHGALATQNLNNTAKGLFTYPAAGAMLWVFFREGNPLFPVYFAASYSSAEWKSAYGYGSDGPGYRPEATPDNPVTSVGGIMNLGGVGGLRWEDTDHPTDVTQRQQSMMLFGQDGSNMFMGNGYHQIFSKFDRRDQVEGDRWNTTLGHKEDWVQGDHNHVTMGDVYVKIGNVSKPAVDAVTRIQQLIKQNMDPYNNLSK